MCKILSQNIGVINKLKFCLPSRILLTLYSTLILPYLNYGILAWGNARKIHTNRIFLSQKRVVRIINNETFFSHTEHLFVENKILNIHDLFSFHLGTFMFQLTSKQVPSALTKLFTTNAHIHTYPTRRRNQYHLPLTRTVFSQKTIVYTGPMYWNTLDASLQQHSSIFCFKKYLKLTLLKSHAAPAMQP